MSSVLTSATTRARINPPTRLAAWCVGPAALAALYLLLAGQPPVWRMLAFVGVLFIWMKAVVAAEQRAADAPPLSRARWLAFTLLWPGMRPQRMLRAATGGVAEPFWRGLTCTGVGVLLILAARQIWLLTGNHWAATLPLLVGVSLVLHFGLFNLLTAGWRAAGVDVRPLFRNPLASAGLRDFWMRRWNIAFSEMCQETLLRAARPLGSRAGIAAVFTFSGLMHEAAISLPVQAGYGMPTLYFALQGAGVLVERRVLREGSLGARMLAAALILLPLPLLFHEPFLAGIVWPIIGAKPWTS